MNSCARHVLSRILTEAYSWIAAMCHGRVRCLKCDSLLQTLPRPVAYRSGGPHGHRPSHCPSNAVHGAVSDCTRSGGMRGADWALPRAVLPEA